MLSKIKKIAIAVSCVGILVGATLLSGCGPSQADYALLAQEKAKIAAQNDILVAQVTAVTAEKDQAVTDKVLSEEEKALALAQLESAKLVISEQDKLILEDATEVAEELGYTIDEIELGSAVTDILSDKEISLFDGKVEYDGDKYEVEEYLYLNGLVVALNQEDMKENAYLTIPEDGITYMLIVDNDLDTAVLDKDEPLTLTLMGKETQIVDWDADSVTLAEGASETILEFGSFVTPNDQEIKVLGVFDGAAKIAVGSESEKILVGHSAKINGLYVYVEDVDYQNYAGGVHSVDLQYGTEKVYQTIESGDEYEDDSPWEWLISDHRIGLRLVENYNDLDEDEEFKPLAYGESIALPNNYKSVQFVGLDVVDYSKVTFEEDTKDGNTYVEVKGKFVSGMEDYDHLYVDLTGIYDEDLVLLGSSVELDGTESTLELIGNKLVVEDTELALDFSAVTVNGADVSGKEDNVRSVFGTIVSVPEDSLEDKKLVLSLPEEQVFANIKVK